MIKLSKSLELRFRASIDTGWKHPESHIRITLVAPEEEIRRDKKTLESVALNVARKFIKTNGKSGIQISSSSRMLPGGWVVDLEKFESGMSEAKRKSEMVYILSFRMSHESKNTYDIIRQRNMELEKKNRFLQREIEKLDEMVDQIEAIKESFRIPFDALKDLMISFDCRGNVRVVNQASQYWFGQAPQDIARKKCKTILRQNIGEIIGNVCKSGESIRLEEKIGDRFVQINYTPMTNRKTGETEVVMVAQDITEGKMAEAERVLAGRNEGVSIMGGTIRHILNSSLTAILGFSQLALSTYDWPRETMIRYLRLIERTALRMKTEISKIGQQKEYVTTKYVDVPGTEDCKEIIHIELDKAQETELGTIDFYN